VDAHAAPLALGDCTAHPIELHNGTSRFDLTLAVCERPEAVRVTLEYNSDLFDAPTVAPMARHLETLLDGRLDDPHRPLSRLPLLSRVERDHVLRAWNDTAAAYPRERGVHQLFEAQVARTPDAVAVISGDEKLTYRELNRRANLLAHHLAGLGVQPETRVGI